MKFLLPDAFL